MKKKIRLPRDGVLLINLRFVYFIKAGLLFRAERKRSQPPTYGPLWVIKDSVKKVERSAWLPDKLKTILGERTS